LVDEGVDALRQGEIAGHGNNSGQQTGELAFGGFAEQRLEIAEVVIDESQRDPGPFGYPSGSRLELALLQEAQQRVGDDRAGSFAASTARFGVGDCHLSILPFDGHRGVT